MSHIVRTDFAVLAPVPREHIDSAISLGDVPYVAFGSMAFEFFRKLDEARTGDPVPVVIYPSHEETPGKLALTVAFSGWYVGSAEDSVKKRHDEEAGLRPPTCSKYPRDNSRHWAVFWHVAGLAPVPAGAERRIGDLQAHSTGKWKKNAPPRGPQLIAVDDWLERVLAASGGST